MKLMRIMVAYLIAFSLCLSFTAQAQQKTDAALAEDEIQLLTGAQIISESDTQKDRTLQMTRAEFAMLMVKLRGLGDMAESLKGSLYFHDVENEYEEASYIYTAATLGLMNYSDDGYFWPQNAVTYQDAVRAVVHVLGQNHLMKVNANGDDYVKKALNLKLLDGVNNSDGKITRGGVYKLIANSLDAPVYVPEAKLLNSNQYALLEEYHKIYYGTGIVEGDEFTGLKASSDKTARGYIKINGQVYKSSFSDCLGKKVEFFYKSIDGVDTIIYIKLRRNEIIEINVDNIESYRNKKYSYINEDGRRKTVDISKAYIIYNYQTIGPGFSNFIPQLGKVELIDNNSDGCYDVVKIISIKECIAKGINYSNRTITPRYGNTFEIKEDVIIRNMPAGDILPFDRLLTESVLEIVESPYGKILTVDVYRNSFSGEIEAVTKEDEKTTYTIKGKEYELTPYALNAFIGVRPLALGDEGIFYLNSQGKISWIERFIKFYGEGDYEFGLLVNAAKKSAINDNLQIRVYSQTGVFENFDLKKTVYVDDTPMNQTQAYTALCKNGEFGTDTGSIVNQLIRYRLNSKKEVTHIDLVGQAKTGEDSLYQNLNAYEGSYNTINRAINDVAAIGGRTVAFVYPVDDSGKIDFDNDSVLFAGNATGFLDASSTYTINSYRVNKLQGLESVICIEVPSGAGVDYYVPARNPVFVYLGSKMSMDENGDFVTKIRYANISSGAEQETFLDKSLDIDAIEVKPISWVTAPRIPHKMMPGDLFKLSTNAFGVINAIDPIFSYKTKQLIGYNYEADASGSYYTDGTHIERSICRYNLGTLMMYEDGYLLGTRGTPSEDAPIDFVMYVDSMSPKVYDGALNELRSITPGEIVDFYSGGSDAAQIFTFSVAYDSSSMLVIQ